MHGKNQTNPSYFLPLSGFSRASGQPNCPLGDIICQDDFRRPFRSGTNNMELYWQVWSLLGRRIKDSCVARLDRALDFRSKPCLVRQLLENFLHQNPEFSDVKLRNRLIDRNRTFIYIKNHVPLPSHQFDIPAPMAYIFSITSVFCSVWRNQYP